MPGLPARGQHVLVRGEADQGLQYLESDRLCLVRYPGTGAAEYGGCRWFVVLRYILIFADGGQELLLDLLGCLPPLLGGREAYNRDDTSNSFDSKNVKV